MDQDWKIAVGALVFVPWLACFFAALAAQAFGEDGE